MDKGNNCRFGGPDAPYKSKVNGRLFYGKARKPAQRLDAEQQHWQNTYVPKSGSRGHSRQSPGAMKCCK